MNLFERTELLMGPRAMEALSGKRVLLFGTGGVGSWCAEALIRSGLGHLTLVDDDCVAPSNVNRQRMATPAVVGAPKVEVLRSLLLDINPGADITALQRRYTAESSEEFRLDSYDYVLDAIDALKDKKALILNACRSGATFFSSMGAAGKADPTQVRTAEFWDVRGCPLAAALRKRIRQEGELPEKPFQCVYSQEQLPGRGTLLSVTGTFGFTLASLVLQDIYRQYPPENA